MQIFCTSEFKTEFKKLIGKKSYSDLKNELISYFFIKKKISGTRLNASIYPPLIKKRLKGKGGYRVYFLWYIKNDKLYLMYVHPKTGVYGVSNIDSKLLKELSQKLYNDIKNNTVFEMIYDTEKKSLTFIKP